MQWATAYRFVQDAITMLAFQSSSVGFVGISFVRQNTLCFCSFYHGPKPVGSHQHEQGWYGFYP
jgi:hypothetical protein